MALGIAFLIAFDAFLLFKAVQYKRRSARTGRP
jgi:hypothetical protein